MTQVIKNRPLLSVIIPTYKRESALVNTLKTVLSQTYEPFETIVVDQTPSHLPETADFLRDNSDKITLLHEQIPNVCRARNIGIRAAKGDILLFLDDDVLADKELLKEHVLTYQKIGTDGVAGVILAPEQKMGARHPKRFYRSRLPWLYTRFDHVEAGYVPIAPGGNMSFKRELIEELGGWDENYIGNSFREESDFCLRFIKSGHRIYYNPCARLIHVNVPQGGQHNELIHSFSPESHRYYRAFFQNNIYFYLRNVSHIYFPYLSCRLYREHVFNRTYLRAGLGFLISRTVSYLIGLSKGKFLWLRNIKRKKGHL